MDFLRCMGSARRLLLAAGICGSLAAQAASVTVTQSDDSINAACASTGVAPCSLRDAVAYANSQPGADTVTVLFNLSGGSARTIELTRGTLRLTRTGVLIDGSSQPGYAGAPVVRITGSGLMINASEVTLKALGFGGIEAIGLSIAGSRNVVIGSWFGLDESGASASPNRTNMVIQSGGDNRIGGPGLSDRNVIANASRTYGLEVKGSGGNLIQGNYIGSDASGMQPMGNNYSGIKIDDGANGNRIADNLVSANNTNGASNSGIDISSDDNVIERNQVGTNAAGDQALNPAHKGAGMIIRGNRNRISDNTISGNGGYGAHLSGGVGNVIENNRIGTDASGTFAVGNSGGITTTSTNKDTKIAGNLVSGNRTSGIFLQGGSTGAVVQGNKIGTDIGGTLPIPNDHGIAIDGKSPQQTIGGVNADQGNIIAWNTRWGVSLLQKPVTNIAVLGNQIFGNGLNGIHYNEGAETNRSQVAPQLTSVSTDGVEGFLQSLPATAYRIEYFVTPKPAVADLSNPDGPPNLFQGQSLRYVDTVTTDAAGRADLQWSGNIGHDQIVTATATKIDSMETSPFSLPAARQKANTLPQADSQALEVQQGEELPVTLTGTDADGDALTYALASPPQHGRIEGFDAATGSLVYVSDDDFEGVDSFTYVVDDGQGPSQPATVTIMVTATPVVTPPDPAQPPHPVPTSSTWGLVLLSGMLGLVARRRVKRQR